MSDILGGIKIPALAGDPVNSPPAGYVFLYVVGSSHRMKLPNGSVTTFATGVSAEEVQDIIGTFITAGSNKISLNYDDVNDVLVVDVVSANIVHQDLSGAGSNTHAQIDAHIASTSNPHTTTKAQVGLGNADNTSDLNKPVSTATQTALNGKENTGVAASLISAHEASANPHPGYATDLDLSNGLALKYDATNPSGFETPAQLTARDTANRARGNHTGTQIAATISDFGAAVLATILSGFAIGANAAIAATDTVLQAFGKIQGQINAINAVLLAQILGDQFQEFSDLTIFTTTANTNQSAALFTTLLKPAAKYRIAIEWDWTFNSATNDAIFAVFVDGVQVSQEFRYELSDTATQLLNNHWFYYPTFPLTQTHTIELRCRAETAGSTVSVSQVRAEIWRVI